MKRILITGANSYIGTKFEKYVKDKYEDFVSVLDMKNEKWRDYDFSAYDVVFHVAGIAHVSKDKSLESLYFKVNRDLAIEVANKAKSSGVKQFIFMSSMIIYGDDFRVGKIKIITKDTAPSPSSAYGMSKLEADVAITKMNDKNYRTVVIRTPMVYGDGCKGNYPKLQKLALKLPIIPDIHNKRSCIEINKLVESIYEYIFKEKQGIFFPQDNIFFDTFEIMKEARINAGKKIRKTKIFNPLIKFTSIFIGKFRKVWGSKIYENTSN